MGTDRDGKKLNGNFVCTEIFAYICTKAGVPEGDWQSHRELLQSLSRFIVSLRDRLLPLPRPYEDRKPCFEIAYAKQCQLFLTLAFDENAKFYYANESTWKPVAPDWG